MRKFTGIVILLTLFACVNQTQTQTQIDAPVDKPVNTVVDEVTNKPLSENVLDTSTLPDLPTAITNNAVASAIVNGETRMYSFLGLEAGKTWSDISKKAFRFAHEQWTVLADVPLTQGRLASVAVTLDNQIYLLGGYTVAEDHSEASTPEVLKFDPQTETYTRVADIPIPSDDAVALVYQDRYIYLISGWHHKGNINLVQVYDASTDNWQQATQFPGAPVFGHAGGIVGNTMIVCDGVKITYPAVEAIDQSRSFVMSDECYKGEIDETDAYRIQWYKLPAHQKPARYRMASTGDLHSNNIYFVGGSDNPYNFNGIGYNGELSSPVNLIFAYDLSTNTWKEIGSMEFASMDHRGLLKFGDAFVTVGGMGVGQQVITSAHAIKIPEN